MTARVNRIAYRVAAVTTAVALSMGVAGCTSTQTPKRTASATGNVKLPAPVTGFGKHAMWKATHTAATIEPLVTQAGVVMVDKTTSGYVIRMVNASTGKPAWSSAPFDGGETTPSVKVTTQRGRPYVIVSTVKGTTVTVSSYDGYGTRAGMKPTGSVAASGKKAATVRVSVAGVLVTGAEKPAKTFTMDLVNGALIAYGKSPAFNGSSSGVPVQVLNGAYLLSYGPKGFAMTAGTSTGSWTSASATPKGAKAGSGTFIASGDSMVVSLWDVAAGGKALFVQSAQTGQAFASAPVTGTVTPDVEGVHPVRLAFDGSWAFWNGYSFNLQTGKGVRTPAAEGVTPNMIVRGVLYGTNAKGSAVTVPLARAGRNTNESLKSVAMSPAGTGVFTRGTDVYSIPLA